VGGVGVWICLDCGSGIAARECFQESALNSFGDWEIFLILELILVGRRTPLWRTPFNIQIFYKL